MLVLHSYGGLPGGAAAYGLSKSERQGQGQAGGVIGLIYLSAFLIEEGGTLASKLPGGNLLPWISQHVSLLSVKSIWPGSHCQIAGKYKAYHGLMTKDNTDVEM